MEHYLEFEKLLDQLKTKTPLEIKTTLDKTFDNYETDKKEFFLDWLEFSFLFDYKLTIQRNNVPTGRFSFNNKMLQILEILSTWITNKRSELLNSKILIEPETIDLSNSTATEKVIYLYKLGVINFLKAKEPFNTSTNALATILSAITGEKKVTIQPMINPILSNNVDQKKNPLQSKKAVSKVDSQLIKIGFNVNKTN